MILHFEEWYPKFDRFLLTPPLTRLQEKRDIRLGNNLCELTTCKSDPGFL